MGLAEAGITCALAPRTCTHQRTNARVTHYDMNQSYLLMVLQVQAEAALVGPCVPSAISTKKLLAAPSSTGLTFLRLGSEWCLLK